MHRAWEIRAGWLIDGSGGPIKRDQVLVVQNGFFRDIRDPDPEDVGKAVDLDLSSHTILPCLIDSHVHLFMSGTDDPGLRSHQLKARFPDIREVIERHVQQHLSCGVMAVRDGGDTNAHALRYRKMCQGDAKGPLSLHVAGRAWHKPGRYGAFVGRTPLSDQSLGEAVASNSEGIDLVKIIQSGLNSLKVYGKETLPQFTLEEMKGAVAAANALGLKTMVHANGRLPVEISLQSGCHSIEHGFFMGMENLQRMADRPLFWVPTAYTMKAYHEHLAAKGDDGAVSGKNLDHQLEQIFQARRLGVSMALGTDAGSLGVHHGRSVIEELRLFMKADFSVQKAVRCATWNGARLLGLDKTGLIGNGMKASFIAVKGEPSGLPDSLNRIACMYIKGECIISCGSKTPT